jgi:tetratricopeptide (TPR) repeat protein
VVGVEALIDQGVRAYARGDVAEAERCFSEALALDPRSERASAYLRQLRAFRDAGRPDRPTPAPSPWDEGPASAATIVIDPEEGLELRAVEEKSDIRSLVPERVAEPHARSKKEIDVWMEGARELFALGDFSGSLEMIEKILRLEPDHAEARAYLRQNEATLIAMYESKLGPLTGVPRLAISPEEVMWLNLDHRAGFLLAQVDGTVNYDELFALSGLPRLDTARILASLLADGVIR